MPTSAGQGGMDDGSRRAEKTCSDLSRHETGVQMKTKNVPDDKGLNEGSGWVNADEGCLQ